MRKRPTARFVNGVIAGAITVFFLAHGTMGGLSVAVGIPSSLSWLAWVALALVAAHVIASIVTSKQQLTDPERPPSPRKKRHLALKWATGCLLAVAAAAHIALPNGSTTALATIIAVSIALAIHLWVGSKSLLKDLDIDRRHQTGLRIAACIFAAAFIIMALVGILR